MKSLLDYVPREEGQLSDKEINYYRLIDELLNGRFESDKGTAKYLRVLALAIYSSRKSAPIKLPSFHILELTSILMSIADELEDEEEFSGDDRLRASKSIGTFLGIYREQNRPKKGQHEMYRVIAEALDEGKSETGAKKYAESVLGVNGSTAFKAWQRRTSAATGSTYSIERAVEKYLIHDGMTPETPEFKHQTVSITSTHVGDFIHNQYENKGQFYNLLFGEI
jgi:hypothetical protein